MAPGRPNLMIFGPIACFRRSGSRFSGQNGPRSSEMRVYIENIGHIKYHQNFKILFWSRESKKTIFTNFPDFFYEKMGRESGNHEWDDLGISSETTRESRVRRPGNLEWDDLGISSETTRKPESGTGKRSHAVGVVATCIKRFRNTKPGPAPDRPGAGSGAGFIISILYYNDSIL